MTRLAAPLGTMRSAYDAIIIGSGYGGGVAASRLARLGLSVAVLERGREFLPGEFPTGLNAARKEVQVRSRHGHLGSDSALYDIRRGDDVHVLVGCALGGTSLINANVCLLPEGRVLSDLRWPEAIRVDHYLNLGFARAAAMLGPVPLPEHNRPQKFDQLDKAAQRLEQSARRVPLHIAFEAATTAGGVAQSACTRCGDCMGGCNVGAKTTVHNTYLADAKAHGAQMFTECRVRYVERRGDESWRVIFHEPKSAGAMVPVRAISAPIVVVAAGTLGSNEILLRSRERGLSLSDRLGRGVSTNADVIGFAANGDQAVNGVGIGRSRPKGSAAPGPAVCGAIDLRRQKAVDHGVVVVEAAIPSVLAPLLPLFISANRILGQDLDHGIGDALSETGRTFESLFMGAYSGAVHNTQTFLAVGHDTMSGSIRLTADSIELNWPGAAWEPVYQRIADILERAAAATGATYMPNPLSARFLGGNLMTVHPLGGAGMGETAASGVVDHKGRVFDTPNGEDPDSVHEGLYVLDGSVVPRSLGVHPLMTITAIAERAMILLARELGQRLDVTSPPTGRLTPQSAAAETNEKRRDASAPAGHSRATTGVS
jgi:cholesterol oxidase